MAEQRDPGATSGDLAGHGRAQTAGGSGDGDRPAGERAAAHGLTFLSVGLCVLSEISVPTACSDAP
ncbi:hypothetical protein [Streptomyces canus]|uniref:hypothetical protein n=1 Tax=Streptomyces canus TaxID=58343 RepID=UPI002DD844F7|nr:hypothetical protein [Streptomyces canus]WSD92508.1 hypothetical protein OG925_48405 [Streptomyces canus]